MRKVCGGKLLGEVSRAGFTHYIIKLLYGCWFRTAGWVMFAMGEEVLLVVESVAVLFSLTNTLPLIE